VRAATTAFLAVTITIAGHSDNVSPNPIAVKLLTIYRFSEAECGSGCSCWKYRPPVRREARRAVSCGFMPFGSLIAVLIAVLFHIASRSYSAILLALSSMEYASSVLSQNC
jgi:hypothetical protein